MTVAGKTGTTEDYNDLWFVGYTPYYTCAVWSGYDNNEKIPEDARNFHKNLWKKVMNRIHEGLEDKDFEMPASVEKASVCSETGLLPRAGCRLSQSTSIFPVFQLNTVISTSMKAVMITMKTTIMKIQTPTQQQKQFQALLLTARIAQTTATVQIIRTAQIMVPVIILTIPEMAIMVMTLAAVTLVMIPVTMAAVMTAAVPKRTL